MYYDDHAPPHFHAYYAENAAAISIDSLEVTEGRFPRRALVLVIEWAMAHRDELRRDWDLAATHQPLQSIDPLE